MIIRPGCEVDTVTKAGIERNKEWQAYMTNHLLGALIVPSIGVCQIYKIQLKSINSIKIILFFQQNLNRNSSTRTLTTLLVTVVTPKVTLPLHQFTILYSLDVW